MLIMMLSLLGMTSLYLAGQDVPGIYAMKEEATAQQLADAAAELVVTWFHDPGATPVYVSGLLAKRQGDTAGGPSYFDTAHRSQFVGTSDLPDVLLDANNPTEDHILNTPPSGFPVALRGLGRVTRMKLYRPLRPGLLATLEVTAATTGAKSMARTVQIQLGALAIPAVRAAVQIGRGLGSLQPNGESGVRVHWGDQRVVGDLIVRMLEHMPVKTASAPVTGFPYDPAKQALDRWTEYWIGGDVTVTAPPPGATNHPLLPPNVHNHQIPSPGVRLDQWEYDSIKKLSLRHGNYYRLDRQGRLHSQEDLEGEGMAAADVLKSQGVGDHRGLVFVDTVDGQPPRSDNMGTLILEAGYLEALLIVQGHVILRPGDGGHSIPVLSPAPDGTNSLGSRIPVELSGIHLQGLLVAAGTVAIERSVRVFGAIMAGETIVTQGDRSNLEVWYNADLSKGLFRGIPVVYRVPGTWRVL
ncbi:MAG TPA: hypothetical protein VJ746_04245 [Nitrospira sp.]|nr:hypothetical protein [Nitrospira sp.]